MNTKGGKNNGDQQSPGFEPIAGHAMKAGIATLIAAYGLSQFYRAVLAVLAPDLQADLAASPEDLARASGVWFLVFAVMQLPVGAALDRIGPRLTAAVIFGVGVAGGSILFSVAQTPDHIIWAMGLIGVGCSPVLMAGYYIFAKTFSAAAFATLAGAMLGLGSLGNLAGAAPLAAVVEVFGWRETIRAIGVLAGVIAVLLWVFIKNPPREEVTQRGSVLDLLRIPQLWPFFLLVLVNYAPAAAVRGLWAGPYLQDVYAADGALIGRVTFIMGMAMIAGSFAYGPLERLFKTRKWVATAGLVSAAMSLAILTVNPQPDLWLTTLLLAIIGFGGSAFPLLVAHGKAFMPAHLTGRGVTLINLFGIGGVGIAQFSTGPIHRYGQTAHSDPGYAYQLIFVFFAVAIVIGLLAYMRVPDRTD